MTTQVIKNDICDLFYTINDCIITIVSFNLKKSSRFRCKFHRENLLLCQRAIGLSELTIALIPCDYLSLLAVFVIGAVFTSSTCHHGVKAPARSVQASQYSCQNAANTCLHDSMNIHSADYVSRAWNTREHRFLRSLWYQTPKHPITWPHVRQGKSGNFHNLLIDIHQSPDYFA